MSEVVRENKSDDALVGSEIAIAAWIISIIILIISILVYSLSANVHDKQMADTIAYAKKNQCWLISSFNKNKNTLYAYFCYKHPKNPMFSNVYAASFDPNKIESSVKKPQLEQIYKDMYKNGVQYGYIVPKPRNKQDQSTLDSLKEQKTIAIESKEVFVTKFDSDVK